LLPISVTTGSFYVYPLAAAFRIIAAAGFDMVEYVAGPEGWLRGDYSVRSLAQRYGLRILSVHPPILPFPGWIDIPAFLPRLAQSAVNLDARLLCIHPPDVSSPDDLLAQRFIAALRSTQQLLRDSGTVIALEDLAHFTRRDASLWWHDPANLLALANEMDLPLVFDTSHADSAPPGLEATYALLRDRIVNVHFSDVRPLPRILDRPVLHTYVKHHQLPGSGRLQLDEFVVRLCSGGYEGPLTLELSPTALAIWSPREARRRLAASRRWLVEVLEQGAAPESRRPA
jgi:sugar phosphate isomerase/epimerase